MKLITHPVSYTSGDRVLILKGRNKDGAHDQRCIMRITNDSDGFAEALQELGKLSSEGERIYASAGARSIPKAIRLFRERQLAAEYDADPAFFYRSLHDRWVSCLMSPQAQAGKLWLFDCDTPRQFGLVKRELAQHYHRDRPPYCYATKNGFHIIVEPFDREELSDECVALINQNPLMLWGW